MFRRKVTQSTKITRTDGSTQETTTVTEESADVPPADFKFQFFDLSKLFPDVPDLVAEARKIFRKAHGG